jgi:GTPase SAR1 family protein
VRLLLVCGRGGVGKTALITKLLHDLHGDVTRHAGDAGAEVDSMVYVELRQSEWRSPDKILDSCDVPCRDPGATLGPGSIR